jgi:signal transduction histidine kinase
VLARIFDARITTKPAGEGLGLAIVKSIVEGHSATIRVDTSLGGTTFEIAFPLVQ